MVGSSLRNLSISARSSAKTISLVSAPGMCCSKAVISAYEEAAQTVKGVRTQITGRSDVLSCDILAGKYKSGQKFPSEAALVREFGTTGYLACFANRLASTKL